jgi:signal peptidase
MDNKRILKSLLGWTIYLVVLVSLVYGIPKFMAYVLETPYPMAAITSGSMWPVLKKGDMVLIKGINSKDDIKIGDIVVYKNSRGFTIHRVTKMNEETVITKGDANNISDMPVSYEEIMGKTVNIGQKPLIIPLLGNVSILINKTKD